ncbi:MAG: DUF6350 family protein [Cellulomonas sp.]
MSDPSGTERLARLRRRVLTSDDGTPRFFASDVDGAPRWVGGLLAGLQGALLSLLIVVLPIVTAYVVTSADPTNAGVPWTRPVAFGGAVWLLAHGVPLTVAGDVLTLTPLGLTLLAVFTCYVSARRSGNATVQSWAAGVGGYTAITVAVALLVRASVAGALLAALGAVVVSGLGLAGGLTRRPEARPLRDVLRPVWSRISAPIRTGAAAGTLAAALLLVAAAVTVVLWVLAGRTTIAAIIGSLGLDPVGGGVLAVAEVAYVPNLVVWALSWLAGPGFQVGTGTSFSGAAVVSGPLPAIPLLGALPQPDAAGGLLAAAPLVLVVAGVVAGVWLHRRLVASRWAEAVLACIAASVVAGGAAGLLVVLASGALGPGRMTDVGASWLAVGAATAGGVLLGLLLAVLPFDGAVRARVARAWRDALARGTRSPEPVTVRTVRVPTTSSEPTE